MTPQPYLSELGKKYFKTLEGILKTRGMDSDDYNIELSLLANQYATHEDSNTKAIEREETGRPGFYNEFENGTVQVNAFFTMAKESLSAIQKLSPKFGLTPADFEKIKGAVEKPGKPKKDLSSYK